MTVDLKSTSATARDPLLTHAREFTTIETDGLTLWNLLQDAGEGDLARQLLDAVLMHEHYTSLLPSLVVDRTAGQIQQQAGLREAADELIQAANQVLAKHARDQASGGDKT